MHGAHDPPGPHASRSISHQLLASIQLPLPPTLPPSPPQSPRPLKRKSPDRAADSEQSGQDPAKRVRVGATSLPPSHARQSSAGGPSTAATRNSPPASNVKREDGELDDPPAAAVAAAAASASRPARSQPVRRPWVRKPDEVLAKLCDEYQAKAKNLKRSGERRRDGSSRWSKNNLYALMEQTDAVLLFAYAFWSHNFSKSPPGGTWESIDGLLLQCKAHWDKIAHDVKEEALRDTANILIGLL